MLSLCDAIAVPATETPKEEPKQREGVQEAGCHSGGLRQDGQASCPWCLGCLSPLGAALATSPVCISSCLPAWSSVTRESGGPAWVSDTSQVHLAVAGVLQSQYSTGPGGGVFPEKGDCYTRDRPHFTRAGLGLASSMGSVLPRGPWKSGADPPLLTLTPAPWRASALFASPWGCRCSLPEV